MARTVLPSTSDTVAAAREVIARYLTPTPTVTLSLRGRPVLTKMETVNPTGAFKVRGALAAVHATMASEPHGAVITSSAGNHGLGVAYAAKLLNARATVVVPASASAAKVNKLRQYTIELIQWGSSYDEAQAHALELSESRGLHFVSPFNDPHVVAGQSTVFAEMLEQAPELEHLVVSVGGGGLVSGCILARDMANRRDVRITGVQPENSAALYHVLRGTAMADVQHQHTIADGLAGGGDEGAITNDMVRENNVPLVLVAERHIRAAVRECLEETGLVMEGSATASYAAITENYIADTTSRVGFIACGRNIALDLLRDILAE
jgi:threonine dehydratase